MKGVNTMNFGEYFRIARTSHKFTLSKLADKIGVPVILLIDLENGDVTNPDQKTQQLIIDGLNLTSSETVMFKTLAIESKEAYPTASSTFSKTYQKPPLRIANDFDATEEEWTALIKKYNSITY